MDSLYEHAIELGVYPKTLMALERFAVEIARDPNDAYAYATMGQWWHWEKEYAMALDHLNTAIRLDGVFAHALCARADLRATCPDAAYRDGKSAVNDATKAMKIAREEGKLKGGWRHRMYLRVLAAAYAEAGRFVAAIRTEIKALRLAVSKSAKGKIKTALAHYIFLRPIRDDRGIIGYGAAREPNDA